MDRPTQVPSLGRLQELAQEIATGVVLPQADEVDRHARWPAEAMQALKDARLTALQVPTRLGGHGQGLAGLATIVETLGRACPSTAMCFGMHCVGTAVIAARTNPLHDERFLVPIADGRHVTTLALSEAGTGANFFLAETALTRRDGELLVEGEKQFVTNGGEADSYVVSTKASVESPAGDFSCVVVERDSPGITWGPLWAGLGMRGNSSRSMKLQTPVPSGYLLGNEGDQVWYVFEVVAPYFLVAMAATYVGIAQCALTAATQHLGERRHSHTGQALAAQPLLQHRIGELWMQVERARTMLHNAARLGDAGSPDAMLPILACKAQAGETAVAVTNEAMTLCGGMGYRDNGLLSRLLRDARASHVMSPTTDMLKLWIGRLTLGLPLF